MSQNQLIIAILFVLASFSAKTQQQNKPLKPVTTAQWQEDIDYFARQLVKKAQECISLYNQGKI